MPEPLLIKSLIIIAASVVAVAVLRRVGLPPILGYLVAGLAIGPQGLGLVAIGPETRFLADLGVVFLMFMVGLEFSIPAMLAARADVLGAGLLQVTLTTAAGAGVAALLGMSPIASFLVGGAVAMSSTAIVLKQLSEQGDLGTRAGRITVGLLLFQDIATLPFLVVVGAYAGGNRLEPIVFARHVATGALILIAAAAIGRPLFRGALAWVAASRSAELFLLAVLLLAVGAAWIAGLAGLAAPLGAFMAGVIVGESDFRHHVEAEVRPFRDVLLGLFFVTIGMDLDLHAAAAAPLAALAWTLVFLVLKPAVVFLIGRLRRWPGEESLRAALAIANGGEFGLLLLNQGLSADLLAPRFAGPVLLGLVVSMALAPVLMAQAGVLTRQMIFARPVRAEIEVDTSAHDLSDHVVLCGCGRIGRPVAAALAAARLDYVALEKDFPRFRAARDQGLRVLYADASRGEILAAAGIERCKLMVLTMLNEDEAVRILHWARTKAPGVMRLANARDEAAAARLLAAGAQTAFPESLAAGLGLAGQSLLLCGLDQDAAAQVITELRTRLRPELRGGAGV